MSKQNEYEWINFDSWKFEKEYMQKQLDGYQYYYDILKLQLEKLLEKNYMNEEFQNQTFLPKEFKKDE